MFHGLKWLTNVSINLPLICDWTEVAKDSVLRGLASVMKLGHLSPRSQLLWLVELRKARGTKWPYRPAHATLCTDITCQVRVHQWLHRSEDKMPRNVSRNKYQLHRMQPVTVRSALASNVCHIHTHHNSVSVKDATMRKPNLNRLYA
jgi:hypothetical protein